MAMSASVNTTCVGKPISYQLVLTMWDRAAPRPVTLTTHLPAAVSLISTTVTGTVSVGHLDHVGQRRRLCSPDGCVRWTLPHMVAGDRLTATIAITTPNTAGVLINTARVASITPDSNVANNERTVITKIQSAPTRRRPARWAT
ncbi:MAG: hypothetical protein R2911_15065 [Caldilineaceae bacterium]